MSLSPAEMSFLSVMMDAFHVTLVYDAATESRSSRPIPSSRRSYGDTHFWPIRENVAASSVSL